MKPKITALLVMPRERRSALLEQLQACGVELLAACDCQEARRILGVRLPPQVVFTDVTLPDGNWRSVLEEVRRTPMQAEVVVCCRLADANLWCDVLAGGAYDWLVEPYRSEEVQHIVENAAARSYMRSLPPARASVAPNSTYRDAKVA